MSARLLALLGVTASGSGVAPSATLGLVGAGLEPKLVLAAAPGSTTFADTDSLPPIPVVFAVDARLGVLREASPIDRPASVASSRFVEYNRLLAGRRLATVLVANANRRVAAHLGMTFALAEVKLWSADGATLEDRLDDLRTKVVREPGQILAGLTGPLQRTGTGLASYREGLVVLTAHYGRDRSARLFAHELAHLFGAVHLRGDAGLMAAGESGEALDPLNAWLVKLHRERRFESHLFPLPPEALGAARSAYLEALDRAPDADAYLAAIALEQGDPGAALAAADRLLGRDTENLEVRLVRGIALRRLGRAADAVAEYERVLAGRPSYAPAHFNLAIALDHQGHSDGALGAYQRAIELDPSNASAFSNLARLFARRGDAHRALAAARRALELAPDFTGARVNLAMAYLEARDPASAEAEARRALAERPEMAEAHEALGAALLAGGQPETAAVSFRRASELEPGEARFRGQEALALRSLARACRVAFDLDRAREALQRATSLAPGDADAWIERADLAFEQGWSPEAREAYTERLRLRPGDAAAHNNLAVVLFRSGEVTLARRHVEAAERLGLTAHPDFLRALAEAESR